MSEQLTFIDLFAGVGGFRRGMELAGHKCVGFCEWDKYAAMSYTAMHLATYEQIEKLKSLDKLNDRQKEIQKEEYRNGEWYSNDIRAVDADSVPHADVWCFGAPCQDFSIAGNRKGMAGDRSCLVREVFRILAELKEEGDQPEWIIYENVRGMLSSEKGFDFLGILLEMESLGYDIEFQLFNSKDYGVPQNRERVYTIGHLRRYGRRKILPIGGNNTEVSINQVMQYNMPNRINTNRYRTYEGNGIAPTIPANTMGNSATPCVICNVNPSGNGMNGNVFDADGIAPTLTTNKGEGIKVAIGLDKTSNNPREIDIANCITAREDRGLSNRKAEGTMVAIIGDMYQNREPRVYEDACPTLRSDRQGLKVREATKQGYAIATEGDSINLEQPNSQTRRGRVGKGVAQTLTTSCNQGVIWGGMQNNQSVKTEGICTCLTSSMGCGGGYVPMTNINQGMRIRKLTPRECFRLQGWADDYFDRAALVNSDSQLYKQAGNGVTVNVVHTIAERLTKGSVTHE